VKQKDPGQKDLLPLGNQGGVIGNDNERKLSRREEIADNADKARADDLTDVDDTPIQARKEELEEEEVKEEPKEEPKAEPKVEEPRKLKLKVGGKEIELTEQEVIERAQKVEQADEYLRTASEAVKNASRLALPPKVDEPVKVEEDDLQLARRLQMGSEEEAAQAIRTLRARSPGVTPDVVAKVVDERLSFQRAAEWFNGEYKDLLSDPLLKELIYKRDADLAQAEPNLGYSERLKRVGDEIRAWKEKVAPPVKTDKEARKAQVAPVPAAAGRQAGPEDEEADDSPESIIAKMAKARGQGRPVQH
jgi:hypothetical protein